MRKLVSNLFITLDGITQAPDQWQGDVFDEDMGKAMLDELALEDTFLLGRVTYDEWCNYWPSSTEEPFASFINHTPKYVVSNTLNQVAWGSFGNAHLINGSNLAAEINRLKEQDGNKIGIGGSPTLVRSLLQMGLLDELTLMVHPVVVGKGRRLFTEDVDLTRLKLIQTTKTGSGVVFLTYDTSGKG
jgi:dihydrofolate reductase